MRELRPDYHLKTPNFYAKTGGFRLNNTICRYKGVAYTFVFDGVDTFILTRPGERSTLTVKEDDPEIDVSVPPLGYVNSRKKVLFLHRPPVRGHGYVQGLHCENVQGLNIYGESCFNHLYDDTQPLWDCLNDKYPVYEQIEDKKEFALSRDLAFKSIRNGPVLAFFRTEIVGVANFEEKIIQCHSDLIQQLITPAAKKIGLETKEMS